MARADPLSGEIRNCYLMRFGSSKRCSRYWPRDPVVGLVMQRTCSPRVDVTLWRGEVEVS